MKAANLLAELKRRGIEVALRGGDIAYKAPKGAMTNELLATFKDQKAAIVEELKASTIEADSGLNHLIQTLENDVDADRLHSHSYANHVEPLKSRLLQRVGLDVSFSRGEGCHLFDEEGCRYLDCIAQYGGLPFGYNPPEIWEALERVQKQSLPNVATQSLLNSAGQLAQKLLEILPDPFEHVVFCNSGAEATEVAIKMCRSAKNKPGIISTKRGFHGLTTGALSATGSDSFQNGFFVRCEDFRHVEFGNVEQLRAIINQASDQFAAFIVEPIQGEAGIVLPPSGYLREVREICNEYDILMVLDEVQTGLGRTGSMFAFEHEGAVPDVITIAKALGGGLMPSGAVACSASAYSTRFGIRHSSTFAGNAMASECGLATIELLTRDQSTLIASVKDVGDYLMQQLYELKTDSRGLIKDVRGQGLMQAIEFDFDVLEDRNGLLPILVEQKLLLHLMISYLLHHLHIRVAPTFMGRDVIRIEPPLTFTKENCDELIKALREVIEIVNIGNSAALTAAMIGANSTERQHLIAHGVPNSTSKHKTVSAGPESANAEFGFLVHLSDLNDLVRFDDSLSAFTAEQLRQLKHELTRSSEPTMVGSTNFQSKTGKTVTGHFVLVPHTPDDLLNMDRDRAIAQIQKAAEIVSQKNIRLIGLGGFTSILTYGGLALQGSDLPPLTSGNGFTAAASMMAVEEACQIHDVQIENSVVAIVGAAGQIGRAMSSLFYQKGATLLLVGRDGSDQRTKDSLNEVADLISDANNRHRIEIAKNISEIERADIVIAVSSAVKPFIQSKHLKCNAVVVDSSRPANVDSSDIAERNDITMIEGGLIEIPGCDQLDLFAGPSPTAAYACVAESALWALQPELGLPSATRILNIQQIEALRKASIQHGFKVLV